MHPFTVTLFHLLLSLHSLSSSKGQPPIDAASLLSFKSKADLDNKLLFTLHEHFDYCQWQGVKCQQGRVVRFALPNYALRGSIPPNTLTSLDQLRVLVLRNNSLFGFLPPDLHHLSNLRSVLLDHNSFSSSLPPSLFSLYILRVLDLSFNKFSATLSPLFLHLDRLTSLKLQFNSFNGKLPEFNQSALEFFNVTGNNFSGKIPDSETFSQFPSSSFALNPNLCGKIINQPCHSHAYQQSSTPKSPVSSYQWQSLLSPPPSPSHQKRRVIALRFTFGSLLLISSLLCIFLAARKKRTTKRRQHDAANDVVSGVMIEPEVIRVRLDPQSNELKEKCGELVEEGGGSGGGRGEKSGNLVFCGGEVKVYTLDMLMRASAEILGSGAMGTTYKAKLDN